MPPYPVAIIGAGASGCLAGIFSARAGVRTLVLETRRQPGAKIRVSGGGRCNVMPSASSLADFETRGSSPFLRNVLGSWPLADVRSFFENDLSLPLVTEATGKVFPRSQRSRDVVEGLLAELARSGAELVGDARVVSLRAEAGGGWRIGLASGEEILAGRVVVATGGLSMPKTGSDGSGWRLLRKLGHRLEQPMPALVPLHGRSAFGGPEGSHGDGGGLAGISLPARLTALRGGRPIGEAAGDFLFTHRGYSGPVVLDISRHWTCTEPFPSEPGGGAANGPRADEATIVAAWGRPGLGGCPSQAWQQALSRSGRASVASLVRAELPRRLADALCNAVHAELAERRASELERPLRRQLLAALCEMPLPIDCSEGYRTAEVTSGGVMLKEVNAKTLESRLAPGVYLCGETLDVSGRIGGFNFLWAWASGRRAGLAAALGAQQAGAVPNEAPRMAG